MYIQQAASLEDGFEDLLKRAATMAQPNGAPFKFLCNLKKKPRILEKMAKVIGNGGRGRGERGGEGRQGNQRVRAHSSPPPSLYVQDYDGNADQVKDYLRGCLVCDSLAEVVALWTVLKAMADKELVKIVQIKNRYRDGSTSSGYADMNINISYEGHVCEVQVGPGASYSRYGPPPAPPSTTLSLLYYMQHTRST